MSTSSAETKFNNTFPTIQFKISGFHSCCRLDVSGRKDDLPF